MWRCVVLIGLVALVSGYGYSERQKNEKPNTLVLAHVIFRHGDRTPDETTLYPNDPHINETYYPYGKGQLTLQGKMRALNLGRQLRQRFNNFLGDLYIPEILEARSSAYPRAQMSLQSVMAGLFPPNNEQIVDEYLGWQPIPYLSSDYAQDKLIATFRSCPAVLQMHSDYEKTIAAELKQFRRLFQYLSEFTGLNITGTGDAFGVQNALYCEADWGLELPEWTKKVWPGPLKKVAVMFWRTFSDTPELRRTLVGPLLNKIIADTEAKIETNNPKKLYLYSGHDFNIVPLLRTFGYWDDETTPYSAYIIIEVHNINGVYGIKVFYQNYEKHQPQQLKLPKCGHFCPMDKFIDAIKENLATPEWCAGGEAMTM